MFKFEICHLDFDVRLQKKTKLTATRWPRLTARPASRGDATPGRGMLTVAKTTSTSWRVASVSRATAWWRWTPEETWKENDEAHWSLIGCWSCSEWSSPGWGQVSNLGSVPAAVKLRQHPLTADQWHTALPSTGGASGSEPLLQLLTGWCELHRQHRLLPWQRKARTQAPPGMDRQVKRVRGEEPGGSGGSGGSGSPQISDPVRVLQQPVAASGEPIGWQTERGWCLRTPAGSDVSRT